MRWRLVCGSLFSRTGGLDQAFKDGGFSIGWMVDSHRAAALAYSEAIG